MIIDFSQLKDVVNAEIIDKIDHKNLNEHFEYPTAEMMVHDIFNRLAPMFEMKEGGIYFRFLRKVRLWETPTSYAEYEVLLRT